MIPLIGLGTNIYKSKNIIEKAIKLGYRHFDSASYYNNAEVLIPISLSDINRKEFFITSKIWDNEKGILKTKYAVLEQLKRSNLKYFDLLLIHTPNGYGNIEAYKCLMELKDEGYIKNIGVSNFNKRQIEKLLDLGLEKPFVNQIEHNLLNQQNDLINYNKSMGINTTGWSPLGKGDKNYFNDKKLELLSKKYNKSIVQIILRWTIQKNISCLVCSTNENRLKENIDIFDFILEEEDILYLNSLNENNTCTKECDFDVELI
jgi:diketogulonate reductase-like aldo/keto reductase